MAKTDQQVTLDQAMSGILALLAAARDDAASDSGSTSRRKTEVVLADAGLTAAQISQFLGKKSKSVSQTILRARSKAGDGVNDG